jgi:predicted nucleotidyltransferase
VTARPSPNRDLLERTARRLRPVLDEVVFVGGHVAELLVTDPAAVRVRQTNDVDVIVRVISRTAYHRLGERLKELGYREDTTEGAPLCRWRDPDGLTLDVMPLDPDVLGFSNAWYEPALDQAVAYVITADLVIRIPPPPIFLATKWAAYDGRGGGDPMRSHDLEDIITVVAGRPETVDEVKAAALDVRRYVASSTSRFLTDPAARDVIAGALPDVWRDPAALRDVEERFRAIAATSARTL